MLGESFVGGELEITLQGMQIHLILTQEGERCALRMYNWFPNLERTYC